jgi:hypothetical protein
MGCCSSPGGYIPHTNKNFNLNQKYHERHKEPSTHTVRNSKTNSSSYASSQSVLKSDYSSSSPYLLLDDYNVPSISYRSTKTEVNVKCLICLDNFKLSEIISLFNCDHKICKPDLMCYALNQIREDNFTQEGVNCPGEGCRSMIGDQILQIIFKDNDQEWTLYNRRVISKSVKITQCPKCREIYEHENRIATCIHDGYQFCTLCLQECHEGACDNERLIKSIKEMMKIGKVAQCPGCMIPYLKDSQNCDHVKCSKDICRIDFCFDCACFRSPTLAHGNHYHRPQCNWYRPSPEVDKYLPNHCTICKDLGRLCPQPPDLETKGILSSLR